MESIFYRKSPSVSEMVKHRKKKLILDPTVQFNKSFAIICRLHTEVEFLTLGICSPEGFK